MRHLSLFAVIQSFFNEVILLMCLSSVICLTEVKNPFKLFYLPLYLSNLNSNNLINNNFLTQTIKIKFHYYYLPGHELSLIRKLVRSQSHRPIITERLATVASRL